MTNQEEFNDAIERNDSIKVKEYINAIDVNPNDDHSVLKCVNWSIRSGNNITLTVLMNNNKVNDTKLLSLSMKEAIKINCSYIAEVLLKNKYLKPSFDQNWAISYAYKNEQFEMIELLWNQDDVKSTLKNDNLTLYKKMIQPETNLKIKYF
jgi:hypothetical protein